MKRKVVFAVAVLTLAILVINGHTLAAPSPLKIRTIPVLSGLALPVHMVTVRDGTKRIFVVQQRGIIKVLQPGASATTDFINLSGVVSSSGNERGLLGLAFHPDFTNNRKFYVYYTRSSDGAIQIAEYKVFPNDPNKGDPSTARVLITIPHTLASNHNGGTIAFGPDDGYLYAATGDGGSGNDPLANAQNINSLLGKFLRIDVNVPETQVPPYNIPPTNPYAGATPGADEIYTIGMRNPYRWSFDRGGTHQLWVGDVGQNAIEEVDIITLGGNYGWRVYEGTQCTGNDPGLCNPANYLMPIYQYQTGSRCSVVGGYVYRGTQNTFVPGTYVYGDYCTGEVFINEQNTIALLDTTRLYSSFGEDDDGELYTVGIANTTGTLEKIVRAKASADLDGDFKTDISVFRPSTGMWYAYNSSDSTYRIQQFGLNGDQPVVEDYDGDNISDIAVYRPSTNVWYYFRSSDSTAGVVPFGSAGDIPAQGDFDGDAKADIAVFRPSTGTWWIRRTTDPNNYLVVPFGQNGDIPVAADYDTDGKSDISVWRPSDGDWHRLNSINGQYVVTHFGMAGDVPVPGDYDFDGKADQAVFRPSTGIWYQNRSTAGFYAQQWGISGDVPAVGDYDGDGKDDIAVFRPSNGVWYIVNSSNGSTRIFQFGLNGDIPAPQSDNP